MTRFSSESQITEIKYLGDSLIPEPVNQEGPECVLRAIINAGQTEMRRVCFSRKMKCDIVLDCSYFKYVYERETRVPLMYDRTPRIGRGLTIFRDMGIQGTSTATVNFSQVVYLPDFRSHSPKEHPITRQPMNGLEFHELMELFREHKPAIGSFAVDGSFHELGPEEIYDFQPSEHDHTEYPTHCVMFIDGGYDEDTDRNYLKFLNSHGPGFGAGGFGRVYFDLVYQINSEFCFHTLSFEESPNSRQHVLSPVISASSTADSMVGIQHFGVTPAGLMNPLTHDDNKRTYELQQFLASSHQCENSEDSASREEALLQLEHIVQTCAKHTADKCQKIEVLNVLVLVSGSYSMRVHIPSDELEVVCIGPSIVNREDFFETLHDNLRNMKEITGLEPVQKDEPIDKQRSADQEQYSAARVLRFKLCGKSIVLLYAILSEVPESSAIFKDLVLSCVDKANLSILDRCRAAHRIVELVPNIENYRTVLRFVNFWATRRCIYSNMNGFLGGTQWAILVARICQIYPSAVPSVLLFKFFEEYSRWYWPSPVMLCFIEMKPPFVVWDAPTKKVDRSHVMPIITPAYPCQNSSADVSGFTLLMLKHEFTLGFEICKKLEKGEARWSDLSKPLGFFKLYGRYLELDVNVKDADDLAIWKRKVEPLWRELPLKIEAHGHGDKKLRAHPHPYEYYDDTRRHCFLFIGLSRVRAGNVKGQVLTTPMPVPTEVLRVFEGEAEKLKGPGMEVKFAHFLQQRMGDVLSKLVSASGVAAAASL